MFSTVMMASPAITNTGWKLGEDTEQGHLMITSVQEKKV